MKSLSKQIKEWAGNNDWYIAGVLTNELKLIQRFGQQLQKVTFELDYHGQNIIARQIQDGMKSLLDRCRKIDKVCRTGCRTQEEYIELDFIRSRAVGLANELAGLLDMVGSMQSRSDNTQDEWITVAEAAKLLEVTRGTVSKWASQGKFTDNGQSGRDRRLLKSSVLIVKQQIADGDRKKDDEDLWNDDPKFD